MTAVMTSMPFSPSIAPAYEDRQPLARFVDADALVGLLSNVTGPCFTTITTRTEPKMLAKHPTTSTPNPFRGNIVKVARVNGMVNWNYSNAVNNQRGREDLMLDFEPLPRKWGRRIPGSPLVEHKGALYVEMKIQKSFGHSYRTLTGEELDTATVEEYLPKRSPSRQGVEREVILRDYALASITSMKLNGTTFILRQSATETSVSSTTNAAA